MELSPGGKPVFKQVPYSNVYVLSVPSQKITSDAFVTDTVWKKLHAQKSEIEEV